MTKTFKQAFYFFRINLVKILAYSFAIGIFMALLAQLLIPLLFGGTPTEELDLETIKPLIQIVHLLVKPIYMGGLIILIYSIAKEQNRGVFSCLLSGVLRWPYMVLAYVLVTLLIFAGMMFFILPGIWLFSRLFLVPYLVMLKNQTPFEAIVNSFQYTKGYSLTILNDIVFLIVIFMLLILLLNILQLLYPVLLVALLLIFQSMAYVIYYRHYEILVETSEN